MKASNFASYSDDISRTGSRYARQAALNCIGREGQQKLFTRTVLIVGCGALGSMQADLLARSGIGRLILVDRDIVELHNLQRQFLFDEQDVREHMPKATAAARRLGAINSEIEVEAITADVTAANVESLFEPADLILDGTDNFETRYLINDASVKAGKPWVLGGVIKTEGTIAAVRPGFGPCLRCIFPDPPDGKDMPTCETQGVLNTAVAWVAALQVTEAIKVLTDAPTAEHRLYAVDIWRGSTRSVTVKPVDDCPCCGLSNFEFLDATRGSSSMVLCGRNAVQITLKNTTRPDFMRLRERLTPHGEVSVNGLVLEFIVGHFRMIIFPDSRVMVMGTMDISEARSLVAKYIGC